VKCPSCNREIEQDQKCSFCDFDIALYNKIKNVSMKLYNKGLEQAQSRDLTGAIGSLTKSVEFDKTNINARNLLGLVYYEVGQIGQALKHWVISTHFQKEENIAHEYINTIQNSGRQLERYNDAVKMYNQSLEYVKQRSEDMAIIQLKKTVNVNPNFVEAYCLLGLCYIKQKNTDKALQYIEKALEIDVNHPKAIRYYKELKPNTVRPQVKEKAPVIAQSKQRRSERSLQEMNRRKASFISPVGQLTTFVLGIVLTAAVIYILILPARADDLKKKMGAIEAENESLKGQIVRITEEKDADIETLKKENEEIKETNQTLEQKQNVLEQIQKMNQVDILYKNNQLEESASLLQTVDTTNLPEENKAVYNGFINKIFPKVGLNYYNAGRTAYNRRNLDDAKLKFEKSRSYAQEQWYSPIALYYIGRISEEQGDLERAKQIYNKVIETYPRSDSASNSKWRLRNIE
jgi:tetratricopeptide (TPR) repeat protein